MAVRLLAVALLLALMAVALLLVRGLTLTVVLTMALALMLTLVRPPLPCWKKSNFTAMWRSRQTLACWFFAHLRSRRVFVLGNSSICVWEVYPSVC
jgi:hypothetical protein